MVCDEKACIFGWGREVSFENDFASESDEKPLIKAFFLFKYKIRYPFFSENSLNLNNVASWTDKIEFANKGEKKLDKGFTRTKGNSWTSAFIDLNNALVK